MGSITPQIKSMEEHFVEIKKTARYFSAGKLTAPKLLIALHGYGQLAQYFIHKFYDLSENWYIVAPEGTHRFYLNGHSGRVGASWMTKEIREKDIEDNNNWLNELIHHLTANNQYREIVLLGFSQGAATAARYFYSNQQKIDKLIVWAAVFPPDIDKSLLFSDPIQSSKNTFVLGNNDEFFNNEQRKETIDFFQNLGYGIKEFDGSHDIDVKILQDIL